MLKKVIMSDLGEIHTGNTPSKKNNEYYESNDIMFIKPDIMSFDIENIVESNEYISEKARDKARIVPANSLLVSCIGNIGKLAINKEEASFNQQINAIVHNENIASSKYLAYLLKYNQKRLEAIANAPVVPIINKTQFSNFEVLIHESLEIQNKIVEVLDKAQELIEKRKEQIEALDELVKSRFIELFGNVITNSKGWETELLGEICELKAGKNIKAKDIYEDKAEDLYPCYGGNGLRGYVKSYSHEGSINLIGRQGALCGNVRYAKGKFYATEHAVVTQPKVNINSYWLHFVLRELDLNRLSTGAAQPGLTVGKLNEVEIPKVPMELQNQFSDFVKQVDKLKFKMKTSLKELEDNFNSLMQKAFKGELFN